MKTLHYLWLAAVAAGLAAGFAIPRGDRSQAAPPRGTASSSSKIDRGTAPAGAATAVPAAAEPLPVSTDSIDNLLALNSYDMYGRLGLWLLDASEEQMADFWSTYRARGETDMWIKDLVFTQWAKVNPRSLLETAKRDGEEGPAWWAWAMSDPDAVLAAVEGQSDSIRGFALRGFSNFHPERALKMLEEKPELSNVLDIWDLAEEVGKDDPKAGLEFMSKYRNYSLDTSFKRWAREDPHEAFRWLNERSADQSLSNAFFEATATEHPEAFAEIAASLPSGDMKRKLENAAFAQLAATDPEAALEQVREVDVPRIAAERYAALGKELISSQPERALEILGELLGKCPDATYRTNWIEYPNGRSGSEAGIQAVNEFISELAAANPRQTMEAVLEIGEPASTSGHPSLRARGGNGPAQVARVWAANRPEEFATWCESQDDTMLGMGAGILSDQMVRQQDYEGAIAWAMRIPDTNGQTNSLSQTLSQWAHTDRESAGKWFAEAPLTEEQRTNLQSYFPEEPK